MNRVQVVVAIVVVYTIVGSAVLMAPVGGPALKVGVLGVLGGVLVWAAVSTASGDESDGSDSVWDLIPNWQYTGRHVEAGGITRDDQEKALDAIQQEAAEIDPEAVQSTNETASLERFDRRN